MLATYLAPFRQRNALVLLLLGFASGLPLALTSGTLQAWMTVEGLDLTTIGFFSLVGQAYVFKFLWSPLMDRYTPSIMGRRRGWLLLTQLLLIAAIFAMGWINPNTHLWWLAALATFVAFFSASQDIVFDAYKTDLLPPDQRGNGAAISVLGYRLAMLMSGGAALWIATRWLTWQHTYWLMALLMLIGVAATFLSVEPDNNAPIPHSLEQAIVLPLREFFGRNNAWLLLLLLVFYKLGDAFAGSLSTTFLIRAVGFAADQVGLVNKSFGLFATIIGVLLGGIMMQRLTLFRALMLFGVLQAVSNLGYWLLAISAKSIITMGCAIFIENLCGGMGTAAFVALLMTLCNTAFSATQFALLSALAAVGRVYVGPIAGWFVELHGWPLLYLFSIVAAVPGLVLLLVCRSTLLQTLQSNHFLPRTQFSIGYRFALQLLLTGGVLLLLTLPLLLMKAWLDIDLSKFVSWLLWIGGFGAVTGVLLGSSLDYCALRQQRTLAQS